MEFEEPDSSPKAAAIPGSPNEFTLWSRGQKAACEQLLEVAQTFFDLDWNGLPLRPRFDPLIVGPTGVGKSRLTRIIARKMGVPCLRLSYAEWLVMGSRESPHTLERVHAFIDDHAQGIIHIDELDKFRVAHTSDWSTAVLVELFLLLDRSLQQPGRTFTWTGALQEKLWSSFLIVGSGSWQSIWMDRAKPSIGFQPNTSFSSGPVQREIAKRGLIPEELLRRFSSELIVLPPATEQDYRDGAKTFGLDRMACHLGVELNYAEAVDRGLGARWLEEMLARLLRLAMRTSKPIFPATAPNMTEQLFLDIEDNPSEAVPF